MRTCKHCGGPIHWNNYWTTWDHSGRTRQLTMELCEPAKGFSRSTTAEPTPKEDQ